MNLKRSWSALIVLCTVSAAQAGVWRHDPASVGDWYDPANWTGGVPTVDHWAYISNGGTAGISAGPALAAGIGLTNGSIRQTGGHVVVERVSAAGGSNALGSYVLRGGTLTAKDAHVGNGRNTNGRFEHHDGAHYVGILYVGAYEGNGAYELIDGIIGEAEEILTTRGIGGWKLSPPAS